jgi:hypothetical protein
MSPYSTPLIARPANVAARASRVTPHAADRSCPAFDDPESPEAHAQLEELDDAMFAAIAGNRGALEKARSLWFNAVAGLPLELVDESREQYLRYADETLRRCERADSSRAAAALAAREVLELLARAG